MSISIGNNMNFNSIQSTLDATKKTSNLENIPDTKDMNHEQMMEVSKSFEAYFVEQVFKEMKKTVPTSNDENEYMSYFGDMLYTEYSNEISKNDGLGIAQMLYESMKRSQ